MPDAVAGRWQRADHQIAGRQFLARHLPCRDVAAHEAVAGGGRALGERIRHCGRANDEPLSAAPGEQLDDEVGDGTGPVVAAVRVGPGAGDGHHGSRLGGDIGLEAGGPEFDPRFLPVGAAVLDHDVPLHASRLNSGCYWL